ncbi:MAG: MFS transporter [Acidobacteria bacterium]|nr:MFS transporter [Acidobacteriota bacterium]
MPLVAYLWIAFALNYIDRQMVYSMFPALKADLGFAGPKIGLIGSVFMWVYTLSMPIAGRLADVWRRDILLVSSLVLWSIATLGCGTASSESSFLAWRGVMGITESLYYPTALVAIANHYAEAARSRAMGIHQSAQFIGIILGGWYGGWAADNTGWRQAFSVAAIAGVVYSLVLWWGVRKISKPPGRAAASRGSAWSLLESPCYLALCAAFAAYCAILWIFLGWYPTFLQERFGLSMTDSGWNATVFVQLSQVTGILGGGALTDRMRKRWPPARLYMTALGVFGSAPFAYWTFASTTLDEARIFSAGFGLFGGLLATNAFAAAYDVIGEENRGIGGGVLNMTGGLSSAAMIYMAGIWKETIGFAGMVVWMAAVSLLSAIVLAAVVSKRFAMEHSSAV